MSREVERFRTLISGRLGWHSNDTRQGFLAEVLRRRADDGGVSEEAYLDRLATSQDASTELAALARELTVTETYFFRNMDQFRAVVEAALPDRMSARPAGRPLRILSAGCASGEEPFSLAAIVRLRLPDSAAWEMSICGVDVNPDMIRRARLGRYPDWSLRETPADLKRLLFEQMGREFILGDDLRRMVTFEERNLLDEDPVFWRREIFDIVFCRNVLMYFSPETAMRVVERLSRSLAPGGYLFLGHAETLRGLSQDYHLRHTHGTFYYQRKTALEPEPHVVTPSATRRQPGPSVQALDVDGAATWIETIRRSSERIHALTGVPHSTSAPGTASVKAPPKGPDLSLTLDLLKRERFSDALELLSELPRESTGDPEALLLRAVLLTHSGRLDEAERVCVDLLDLDEMNAGAHYVLALCREGVGDRKGAVDHDQMAVYLDPAFAMPRLHLGLIARRANDREVVHNELGQALALLQREDASRLLLFGGGFTREGLMALCRAELSRFGERQ